MGLDHCKKKHQYVNYVYILQNSTSGDIQNILYQMKRFNINVADNQKRERNP